MIVIVDWITPIMVKIFRAAKRQAKAEQILSGKASRKLIQTAVSKKKQKSKHGEVVRYRIQNR